MSIAERIIRDDVNDLLSPAHPFKFTWHEYSDLGSIDELFKLLLGELEVVPDYDRLYSKVCSNYYPDLLKGILRLCYTPTNEAGRYLISTMGRALVYDDLDYNFYGFSLEDIRDEIWVQEYCLAISEYTDFDLYSKVYGLDRTSEDIGDVVLGLSKLLPMVYILSEWLDRGVKVGRLLLHSGHHVTSYEDGKFIEHLVNQPELLVEVLGLRRSLSDIEAGNIPKFSEVQAKIDLVSGLLRKLQSDVMLSQPGFWWALKGIDSGFNN